MAAAAVQGEVACGEPEDRYRGLDDISYSASRGRPAS